MEGSRFYDRITARAGVLLRRRVRLNRHHCFVHPAIAQMITAAVTASATTTITTSKTVLRRSRKGLSPISIHIVSRVGNGTGISIG